MQLGLHTPKKLASAGSSKASVAEGAAEGVSVIIDTGSSSSNSLHRSTSNISVSTSDITSTSSCCYRWQNIKGYGLTFKRAIRISNIIERPYEGDICLNKLFIK